MATARVAPEHRELMTVPRTTSLVSIQHNDKAEDAFDVGAGHVPVNPEIQWIRKWIKRRECKRYIPAPPPTNRDDSSKTQKEEKCQCGYPRDVHARSCFVTDPGTKWDPDEHTEPYVTNAFGEIEFPGFGDHFSKFVRVDYQTGMSRILDLMKSQWGLALPNLLISVTGGAKNFHMKTRLKDVFRRGLMKAALSTGAWIVTGGTNAGVMKHVGEAVRDYGLTTEGSNKVICIGVAPWGCVRDKEQLINDMGKWPAEHRITNKQIRNQSFLDPNHSHFILVDNGTQMKFATEINFRTKLENKIASEKTATGSGVPVVLLVLEGGPGTLETCMSAIHNGTPAVIIKGSGRAADILAFAYQNSKGGEVEKEDGNPAKKLPPKIDDSVMADIEEMIEKEFGSKNKIKHVGWIQSCIQRRDLISIFELDSKFSTKDVDVAILKALLKANSNEVMDQLRLALSWNRIDVAKSEIFTDSREWDLGQLDQVMLTAIQLNRTDFVDLFLDHGVSLKDFLTPKRLLTLYNEMPRNSLLHSLLARRHGSSEKKKKLNLADVGKLMQDLIGDYYQPYYLTNPDYKNLDADQILTQDSGTDVELHRPVQDLFLWAVMMNRLELSKLFWKEGNEQTAGALVANSILRSLRHCTDDAELIHKFQRNADEYESLGIGVLNSCYNTDEQKAQDLLIRELENWGQATCILIAVQSDNKKFVSQTACQSLLNHIWMGKMSLDNGNAKLVTSIFMFPMVWGVIRFRDEEKAKYDALLRSQTQGQKALTTAAGGTISRQKTDLGSLRREVTKMDLMEEPVSKEESFKINPLKKLMLFYTAPVIVFTLNVISYLLFLGIYSYILLIEFKETFSVWEAVLIVWVFTIMVEEFRQLITDNATSLKSKLYSYVTDSWNILDMLTILLFILGVILRFIPNHTCFELARVVFAINLISFFLRILHIFSVNKQLGPKLVMIRRMTEDLLSFVIILMVFIVAYAIASEAILYPNQTLSWELLYEVPRKAYWTIYGELFLEDLEGQNPCTNDPALYGNGSEERCPTDVGKYLVPIMMGVYILLTNVLLLNLLIAMFSYTFQHIQDNTEMYWYFMRFQLIVEYRSRPPLPPPLILFAHLYFLARYCYRCCCPDALSNVSGDLRKKYEKDEKLEEKRLVQWENIIADTYLIRTEEHEKESIDHRVKATLLRLDLIGEKMDELQDSQTGMSAGTSSIINTPGPQDHVSPMLEKRLILIENQMVHTHKALKWIMASMNKNFLAIEENMPQLPDPELAMKKEQQEKEEEIQRDREVARELRKNRYKYHYESRHSPYPGSQVARYPVPDEKVSWEEPFPEYDPDEFTSPSIIDQPWADPDLLKLPVSERNILTYHKYDKKYRVDRTSHLGQYKVKDGLPINPRGRTGIIGRGSLGRWGPNHAGDPVITRWKLDSEGKKKMVNGKPLLEFVVIQRSDNKLWALPGSISQPNQRVWDQLKTDFTEEANGTLLEDQAQRRLILEKKEKLSDSGVEVYRNYADDSRNTDNAWLETIVVNYHDGDGSILRHFNLQAAEAEAATWQTMSSSLTLHGSHSYFCQLVAEKHGAYF